jgi:hypothetical protein
MTDKTKESCEEELEQCEKQKDLYEDYELRHALVVTGFTVVAIFLLIGLYALTSNMGTQVPVDPATGKPLFVVHDPWLLARSIMLKLVGVLTGYTIIKWALISFNHITPADYLRKIGETSLGSAVFLGLMAIALGSIYCYG